MNDYSITLPKGFSLMGYDWQVEYPGTFVEPEKKKCTCGVSITMGVDDDISYHSKWCDLVEKK